MNLSFERVDPYPTRMFVKLPYVEVTEVTSDATTATTAGTQEVFNLNSLFKPKVSGGHQPYLFNTYETIYRRYVVHAVDVYVRAMGPTASITGAIIGTLSPGTAATTTGLANAVQQGEKPFFQTRLLGVAESSIGTWTFTAHYSMADLVGITKQQMESNVEEYAALVTASPSRMPTLVMNAFSTVSTSQKVLFHVKLVYHAEFFERISLGPSS